MTDSVSRFSSRVENYLKYRPTYPPAILEFLKAHCRLTEFAVVADIGSGTGLLTELFLKNGNYVFGVEPNSEMRSAAENLLQKYSHFKSIPGRAEETTLDEQSVDFITIGQAFHWFDRSKTRQEFARVLKPQGWIALVENMLCTSGTSFTVAYHRLWQTCVQGYSTTFNLARAKQNLVAFYGTDLIEMEVFNNKQVVDYNGLKGRLLSSSGSPEPGHPTYPVLISELENLFQTYQVDGNVTIEYETVLWCGQLH